MSEQTIRVLLIEDTTVQARLVQKMLERVSEIKFKVTWVATLTDALKSLAAESYDVVLSDLQLPDSYGLGTFRLVQDHAYHLPIVLLTNIEDNNMGLKAIESGAQDYLIKSQLDSGRLVRVLEFAMERHRILKETRDQYEAHIQKLRSV